LFPKSCGFGNQNKGGKPLNPPKSIGLSILQFPTKHRLLEKLEHPPCVTLPAINLPKGKIQQFDGLFLWDIDIDGIIILTSNISSKSMVYPMILFSISSHKPAFLMVKLPFFPRLSAAVSSRQQGRADLVAFRAQPEVVRQVNDALLACQRP